MHRVSGHRHSIFCILPPHMLESVAQKGNPAQRAAAMATLATDNTFRGLRALAKKLATGALGVPTATPTPGKPKRTIYDAAQTTNLPGTLVRIEGSAKKEDAAVDEAYDGLGDTYRMFWQAYGRDSIDDEGLPLNATVRFGTAYNNAFWNGERMVFGDGDGELFNRFTVSKDIIGHELTHGVTEDEAGLMYVFQSGALNEHVSDVFGSLVKQHTLNQTADKADWLIGAGLLTPNVNGTALRSMKNPGSAYDDPVLGKDPQPKQMSGYVSTFRDNGGVHINSGIPNHAFYQTATAIGGKAWEKAGRIWYEALRDPRLRPSSGFRRFASLTLKAAGRLYGEGGTEWKAVRSGWNTVGIEL
jgi:Zn-dependent metalloprotease